MSEMMERRTAHTSSADDLAVGEVFEIFQQEPKDMQPHHGGNLRAPDGELATHYAKEFYSRRQESLKLWVIPRAALWEINDTTYAHLPVRALADEDSTRSASSRPFAVFGQKLAGKPMVWLQDVEAVSQLAAAEAALQVAHSVESGCLRLWLCPRSSIIEVSDPDLLQPPLDRSYRRLDGYNIREKLRAARQRVMAQGEKQL